MRARWNRNLKAGAGLVPSPGRTGRGEGKLWAKASQWRQGLGRSPRLSYYTQGAVSVGVGPAGWEDRTRVGHGGGQGQRGGLLGGRIV